MQPNPYFFFVRIPKIEQLERKEKNGSIYLHPNQIWMTRNMQCGEIVSIGHRAKEAFPKANIGDVLIFHHFTESADLNFFVSSDEEYNYYIVPAIEYNGDANLAYGIYNGDTVIPHKDYIFLELGEEGNDTEGNISINSDGIYLFNNWEVSRDDMLQDVNKNMERIKQLSVASRMNQDVTSEIGKLERRNAAMSAEMSKKIYKPYTIAYANAALSTWASKELNSGDTVYCLNIAANTIVEFNEKEYRIVKSKYIGLVDVNTMAAQ